MATIYANDFEITGIQAVLFDKDGTFVDSNSYWGKLAELRVNELIKYFGLDENLYEYLCNAIGYDIHKKTLIDNGPVAVLSREEVVEVMTNVLQQFSSEANAITVSTLFYKVHGEFLQNIDKYTTLLDGALDCFEKCRKNGLKMAVVTSDSKEHTIHTLKLLNIHEFFECVIGCDSCDLPKKSGKPALVALELLGVKPENTIVIGDAPMDAQMARNSNCRASIMVTTGQVLKSELFECSPFVIDNLRDLSVLNN